MGNKQSSKKSKDSKASDATKAGVDAAEALPTIPSMRRIFAKPGAEPGIPCMPELIEAAKGAETKDAFLAICNGVLSEHGVPAEPCGALLLSIFEAVFPSNELSPQDAALCALCVLHLRSDFDDVADALFALMDEDNNGDLDVVELAMWAPPLLTILSPGARSKFCGDDAGLAIFVAQHLDEADDDGDRMLDFGEFSRWFKRVCTEAASETPPRADVAAAGDTSAADTIPPAEGSAPPADEAAATSASVATSAGEPPGETSPGTPPCENPGRGVLSGPPAMPRGLSAPPNATGAPSSAAGASAPPPVPVTEGLPSATPPPARSLPPPSTLPASADGWSDWDIAAFAGLAKTRELLSMRTDDVVATSMALAAGTT